MGIDDFLKVLGGRHHNDHHNEYQNTMKIKDVTILNANQLNRNFALIVMAVRKSDSELSERAYYIF